MGKSVICDDRHNTLWMNACIWTIIVVILSLSIAVWRLVVVVVVVTVLHHSVVEHFIRQTSRQWWIEGNALRGETRTNYRHPTSTEFRKRSWGWVPIILVWHVVEKKIKNMNKKNENNKIQANQHNQQSPHTGNTQKAHTEHKQKTQRQCTGINTGNAQKTYR